MLMQMHSFLILCWYILSIVHRVLGLSLDLQDSTFSKIWQGKNIKITLCFSSCLLLASCVFTLFLLLFASHRLSSSVFRSEPSWFPIRSSWVQESSQGCRCGVSRTWTWSRFLRPCTAASTPGTPTCCSSPPQPLHTTYTCGWVRRGPQYRATY